MSLSSLIVQREVATMRQVEEALARQVIYGGDLATNLLEVARVDEEVLLRLVSESLRLRSAGSGELPVAQPRALALIPPELAVQRSFVPLKLEGETLVLAVAEPLPSEIVDQLAFALGLTLEQRAATTVRVRQAIARAYGVPLERRMQRLIARLNGEVTNSGSMPPPLGAAPVVEAPRPPSAPPPRTSQRMTAAIPVTMPPADRDSEPPSVPHDPVRGGLLQREVAAGARLARRRRGPLTLDLAKAEAEEAADRDSLLDLYFDFSLQFFEYSTLFLVHGDIAEGRDAFGAGASRDRVLGIGVPLDLPGLMSTVRDKRASVVARAPSDGLEAVLLADLGRPRDAEIAIVPLVVRTRAVALLVGDCGAAGVDPASVQQVVAFAGALGKAFERLIVRRKLAGFIAGSRTAGVGRIDPSVVAPKKPSAPPPAAIGVSSPKSSAPPPTSNVASVRTIAGPPIPREEPTSPARGQPAARPASMPPPRPAPPPSRAASPSPPRVEVARVDEVATLGAELDEEDTSALFDELGWESAEVEGIPPAPPSAAISVPAHAPALRAPPSETLPSVMVDPDDGIRGLVEQVIASRTDERIEAELLRLGERALRVLMTYFPGPVFHERARIAGLTPPPRASECGTVLRLVARQRKLALPFVVERLTDDDAESRGWATHLLAELPYVEALPHALLRLRDDDPATRTVAALALAAIARAAPEQVHAAVLGLAHLADPFERGAAMRVMAELRDPVLVPDLVRALGDGDEIVVELAHGALVQVTRQDLGTDARRWLSWWELNAQRHRVEWLIDALTHEVSEIRRAAGEELKALTKEYFGYAEDLPARDRERAQQRYRDWWITEGKARFRRKA